MRQSRAIWMVRHAPAAVSGMCYGQTDVPVTIEPHEAAARLAKDWELGHPGLRPELWSSPLSRCRLVAEALAGRWRCALEVDARLAELSFGMWDGKSFAEIEREDGERFGHWMARYEELAPPGGESVSALMLRVARWLGEREIAPAGASPVLAVCHAGVIRSARALRQQLPYRAFVAAPVPHLELELLD